MARNPYKTRELRDLFDLMLREAHNPDSREMYFRDSKGVLRRRHGASHRCSFWAGVEVVQGVRDRRPLWVAPNTLGGACYAAGKAFAGEIPDWVPNLRGSV